MEMIKNIQRVLKIKNKVVGYEMVIYYEGVVINIVIEGQIIRLQDVGNCLERDEYLYGYLIYEKRGVFK